MHEVWQTNNRDFYVKFDARKSKQQAYLNCRYKTQPGQSKKSSVKSVHQKSYQLIPWLMKIN